MIHKFKNGHFTSSSDVYFHPERKPSSKYISEPENDTSGSDKLSSFKILQPSHGTRRTYEMTVSKHGIHLNKGIYCHFHGYNQFRFGLSGHKLALIKARNHSETSLKVPLKRHNYDGIKNIGLREYLTPVFKRLHEDINSHRYRFKPIEIKPNYIIFDLTRPSKS